MPDSTTHTAAEIRLEDLTKVYPGQAEPAVDRVNLVIPAGEIVVFVGPSGCGKTTTLRMINRLIEPTSGRIVLDGEDVTHINPDQLRRRMGYAIQKTGLFPHMTIHANIATVPQLVGWDRDRIDARVDDLLDLVGLPSETYRDRYPKELSGGQQQRVGVARAMAADPPVMLMDEPFGATDPITRERLQNEFLRIQSEIGKTIVFVTHDIDEAIKMGDRIAILGTQSSIRQYDTPEHILTSPANDFVSDFIGSGASLKRLNLSRVRDIEATTPVQATWDTPITEMKKRLDESDASSLLVVDDENRPQRWLTMRDLNRVSAERPVEQCGQPVVAFVEPQATLADALDEMLTSNGACAVVVDGRGSLQGIVDIDAIYGTIRDLRAAADVRDRDRTEVVT